MATKRVKIDNVSLYPDGKGGQLGDRGFVNGAKIVKVEEGNIVELEKEINSEGDLIVKIDEERRAEIARNHTGQHILSQAIIRVCDTKTVSFHMGEEYSTIDLQRNLSEKEIIESEELANEVVSKALEVKKYFVDREELPNLGLRKISDVKDKKIRIVEIGDFDKGMCAGFHVNKTSEVMLIKILKSERIKGGLYRLYFVCGKTALRDYRKKNDVYNESVSLLSNPNPIESLKSKLNELKNTKKRLNNVVKEYMRLKAKEVYDSFEEFKDCKIGSLKVDYSQNEMKLLIQNALSIGNSLIIVYNDDNFVIGSNIVNLKEAKIDAKGGGNKNIFMGKFDEKGSDEWVQKTLENLKSYI